MTEVIKETLPQLMRMRYSFGVINGGLCKNFKFNREVTCITKTYNTIDGSSCLAVSIRQTRVESIGDEVTTLSTSIKQTSPEWNWISNGRCKYMTKSNKWLTKILRRCGGSTSQLV